MSQDDATEDRDDDGNWFERALADEESGGDGPSDSVDESVDDPDGDSVDDPGVAGEAADEPTTGATFDGDDPDPDELDAAFEAASRAAAESGDVDATGDASGSADDFGLGAPSDTRGERFEDDFGSAFGGGGESDAFDDEDFESDLPRLDVGIDGLDRMIRGGIPRHHLMVAIGSAGTGKTTFGLQYLNHGLERGENGVFITLEQSHESIMATAAEYGWDFEGYEDADELAVVDLDPIEMANSLDNIRGELPGLIEEFDADRFVLDSVSLLEMMYDDQARQRTELFDFTRSLKRAGVTTLLTSEADEDTPYASRHGIIEYLTDAVFVLQYVRGETSETRLAVEIQKIRNANHSRETKPYELTDHGISVYEQANIF